MLSVQAHSAISSVPITSSLARAVLVSRTLHDQGAAINSIQATTGPRVITQKALSLLTKFWMSSEEKQRAATACRAFRLPIPSVVVPVLVWAPY